MRSFFSNPAPANNTAPPPAAPAATGGWAGLSGASKLAILSGAGAVAIIALVLPGWNSKPPPPQSTASHQSAPISGYDSPPPVTDVVNRVTGNGPPQPLVRARPVPVEMALYAVKPPPPPSAATPVNASASGSASGGNGQDGLPPTNRASIIRNPDFLIRAGDAIPCNPVEAQRSDQPSFSTCDVPAWFRSSNQKRGLLPPHTRLFGHIREGMQAGEQRLGIVFSVIETKWFDQPIAAPASDAMGRGGVDADIKTFFWDRAGAVALYALLDIGAGVGQNLASSALSNSIGGRYGGTSFNLSGPTQSLAAQELGHRINRPPLATRDQALPITVIVGQNLDFTDACRQAMQVDPMACPVMSR